MRIHTRPMVGNLATRNTGPRTPGGKRQSSANAIKHGLSFPIRRRSEELAIIEQIALALAEGKNELHQKVAAANLAEAEWDMMRLNHIKVALIESGIPEARDCSDAANQPHITADAIGPVLSRLAILARYEGRIWARHRRALHRYDTVLSNDSIGM